MNTPALLTMIVVDSMFVLVTGYFFWLVLKVKPKEEPDSYSENQDDQS